MAQPDDSRFRVLARVQLRRIGTAIDRLLRSRWARRKADLGSVFPPISSDPKSPIRDLGLMAFEILTPRSSGEDLDGHLHSVLNAAPIRRLDKLGGSLVLDVVMIATNVFVYIVHCCHLFLRDGHGGRTTLALSLA